MKSPIRIALALALAAVPVAAKPGKMVKKGAAAAPEKGASVEGITEYTLANGLKVLLFPDSSKPTVTVNVTYFVGSRHEGYGETGMAHLLEHMLFKGTPTHDKIFNLFTEHGAQFNGTTSYDRTNYFEILPDAPGNLEFALAIEADRMVHSRVAKEDLDKEFSVVRNEFEMGENSPESILEERLLSTAYLWHNYGKSTIGSRSDIERVPIDRLQAFYRRFYQPDNAMLVIAGKFEEAKALDLVQKEFGAIARPERKLDPTYTVEPVQDGERNVTLRRSGDVAMVGLVYHGVAGASEELPAEEAMVDLLTAKPSGRLYKALVETGLATEVRGDAGPLAEPGVIELFAKVRLDQPGNVEKVKAKMIEVVEGLGKAGVTDEEVGRFKARAARQVELSLTDSARIGIELSEWASIGDWRMLFLHRDRVKALGTPAVKAVAAKFLKPSNRTVGLFLPEKAPDRSPLPEKPDVAAMVKGYKGQAALAEGEVFVATVDNVEKRTRRSALANGMKLALLPKSTRGGAVKAVLGIHFGSEQNLKGKQEVAQMIPRLLLRGTKRKGYQQVRDELDRLKAEVKVDGDEFGVADPSSARLRISTVKENLPAVLALLGEIVEQPAFAPDQFEVVKKEQLTRLEEEQSDPQALAFNALLRKVNPWPKGDVRYEPSIGETIANVRAIKVEEVAELHRGLWGASHAELAIVGDFDEGAVKAAVEKAFGGWKSPRPFVRIATPWKAVAAGAEEIIKTPDKESATIGVAHGIELRDDDPDFAGLQLINHVLGGAAKSRLMERLRQKEGISYGAFSAMGADSFDKNGLVLAGAICAPQNAKRAMTLLLEEVGRMSSEGIGAAELADAKKSWQLAFDNRLARDELVAAALEKGLYTGRTLDFQKKMNERIQALTPADVARVAKKYIDISRLQKVQAGDLKG